MVKRTTGNTGRELVLWCGYSHASDCDSGRPLSFAEREKPLQFFTEQVSFSFTQCFICCFSTVCVHSVSAHPWAEYATATYFSLVRGITLEGKKKEEKKESRTQLWILVTVSISYNQRRRYNDFISFVVVFVVFSLIYQVFLDFLKQDPIFSGPSSHPDSFERASSFQN